MINPKKWVKQALIHARCTGPFEPVISSILYTVKCRGGCLQARISLLGDLDAKKNMKNKLLVCKKVCYSNYNANCIQNSARPGVAFFMCFLFVKGWWTVCHFQGDYGEVESIRYEDLWPLIYKAKPAVIKATVILGYYSVLYYPGYICNKAS